MSIRINDEVIAGFSADKLSKLSDTNISNPTEGQVLKYDSTSDKWINGTGGGSGGSEEDNLTITKNTQNKIQAVALKNQNSTSTSQVINTWTGTLEQYNSIQTKSDSTLYNITDDVAGGYTVYTKAEINERLANKQDNLISGTNIKTINDTSILGFGNISVATESQITTALNNKIQLVSELPTNPTAGVLYLIPEV